MINFKCFAKHPIRIKNSFSKATHSQIRNIKYKNGGLQVAYCIGGETHLMAKAAAAAARESPNEWFLAMWVQAAAFHVKRTRMGSRDLAESQIHNAKPQRASLRSTFGSSPNEMPRKA
jgi:hypothetical protein